MMDKNPSGGQVWGHGMDGSLPPLFILPPHTCQSYAYVGARPQTLHGHPSVDIQAGAITCRCHTGLSHVKNMDVIVIMG